MKPPGSTPQGNPSIQRSCRQQQVIRSALALPPRPLGSPDVTSALLPKLSPTAKVGTTQWFTSLGATSPISNLLAFADRLKPPNREMFMRFTFCCPSTLGGGCNKPQHNSGAPPVHGRPRGIAPTPPTPTSCTTKRSKSIFETTTGS